MVRKFSLSLILVLLLSIMPGLANSVRFTPKADSLLTLLVSRLDSADCYKAAKVSEIELLKASLQASPNLNMGGSVETCLELSDAFVGFSSDSTLSYLRKARNLALLLPDSRPIVTKISISIAERLVNSGSLKEASDMLDRLEPDVDQTLKADYLYVLMYLYHELLTLMQPSDDYYDEYYQQYSAYNEEFLATEPQNTVRWLRCSEQKALSRGDVSLAVYYNEQRRKIVGKNTLDMSSVCYDFYTISLYDPQRLLPSGIENLLKSANLDLLHANQDVASFNKLAALMIDIGEVQYAELFSNYSYNTIVQYGSRVRRLISMDTILSANSDYRSLLEKHKKRLTIYSILLVVFAFFLISTIIYIGTLLRKQKKIIRTLETSNKVSNGYLLEFFKQYSVYIARMNAFRRKININLRRGNIDYLIDLTNPSRDITADELKFMYHSFDEAFLEIYPNFVSDFNSKLKPEYQIVLKENQLLNTELRIFALIKLGVSDSKVISDLLHCSIKTVYNKRSEINSKLIVSKQEFEKIILSL